LHDSGSKSVIDWLLEDDQPAVRYRTLVELLELPTSHPDVRTSSSKIAVKGWASKILSLQNPGGYWESNTNLYRPKYTASNWMALILSDLGLTREHPGVKKTAELFLKEWMDDGKENIFTDEVCIVGNTARYMTRFGYTDDNRTQTVLLTPD